MSCRVLFEGLPKTSPDLDKRAELIEAQYPGAACELESVSPHSPGIVDSREYLHRYIFSPIHMNGDRIKSSVFSDCQDKGLSCERSGTIDVPPDTHRRGRQQVDAWNGKNPKSSEPRSYVGVVSANCGDIRSIIDDGGRVAAVYDTALVDNVSHADVFHRIYKQKSLGKQARRDIALKFTEIPVAE
jgi:hypothetical protein